VGKWGRLVGRCGNASFDSDTCDPSGRKAER
jgi:hypothetical protein